MMIGQGDDTCRHVSFVGFSSRHSNSMPWSSVSTRYTRQEYRPRPGILPHTRIGYVTSILYYSPFQSYNINTLHTKYRTSETRHAL